MIPGTPFLVRPEFPTAAVRSSQVTLAAVDNSAPLAIRPESTYKSGKVVQTTGATSMKPIKVLNLSIERLILFLFFIRATPGYYGAHQRS
jgi:hypothetical protein